MKTGGINIAKKENHRTDALSLGVSAKSFGNQEPACPDFAQGKLIAGVRKIATVLEVSHR